MFDAVRNNKRIVQAFLAVITLPFAFWGVESYVRNAGAGNDIAVVGDQKITPTEFSRTLREQQDQMRQTLGDQYDPAMFNRPEIRRAIVDQLVGQRLMMLEASRQRVFAGDEQLRNTIAQVPALQENGQFSMKKYEDMLRGQGESQASFEGRLRRELTLQQIAGAVADSAVASKGIARSLMEILAQSRDVSEARFEPDRYLGDVKVGDEELRQAYEVNKVKYERPEAVRAEYLVLTPDALGKTVNVSEEEARQWFDGHAGRFQQPEERRASHILIAADASGDAEVRKKAKARAEELLVQLRAHPQDFGKLAKEFSQDTGSAEKAGDLGFFAQGAMPKPFDDQVFSMREGDTSGVVETDFGYHIIRLTGIKPGRQPKFDEVRGEIQTDLRQQALQRKFAESAEAFANVVYEQSDSLKPAAEKFGLELQKSDWIAKDVVATSGAILANPRLRQALFSEDAIRNKRNTEAVEIGSNAVVAARVLDHRPAALRPFDEVKAEIREVRTRELAAARAYKAGTDALEALRAGKTATVTFGGKRSVSRLTPAGLAPAAVRAIFSADASTLPAYAGYGTESAGFVLYRIDALGSVPSTTVDRQQQALRREFARVLAQEDYMAYLAALRGRYTVQINQAALEAK